MNEKKGSNTIFLMVVITQEQGAWSLCKIYLRLGAIHAYIAHSHHSTLLPKWLQILPIFYISKPKYIHFTHISHQVNSLLFFFYLHDQPTKNLTLFFFPHYDLSFIFFYFGEFWLTHLRVFLLLFSWFLLVFFSYWHSLIFFSSLKPKI